MAPANWWLSFLSCLSQSGVSRSDPGGDFTLPSFPFLGVHGYVIASRRTTATTSEWERVALLHWLLLLDLTCLLTNYEAPLTALFSFLEGINGPHMSLCVILFGLYFCITNMFWLGFLVLSMDSVGFSVLWTCPSGVYTIWSGISGCSFNPPQEFSRVTACLRHVTEFAAMCLCRPGICYQTLSHQDPCFLLIMNEESYSKFKLTAGIMGFCSKIHTISSQQLGLREGSFCQL